MIDTPIVFLHGYPLNHAIWRSPATLSSCVLMPDLPGFGETPFVVCETMDDYATWALNRLHSRGHERAIWVGHSMGGYIALALARSRPEAVAGLVLVCTQARADTVEARANRHVIAERVRAEGTDFVVDLMAPKLLHPRSSARAGLIESVKDLIRTASPEGISQAQRAMATRADQREALAAMRMPVLICHGERDLLFTSDRALEMAAVLPDVRVEAFSSSGHMVMMEEPDRFNSVLSDFLQSRFGS